MERLSHWSRRYFFGPALVVIFTGPVPPVPIVVFRQRYFFGGKSPRIDSTRSFPFTHDHNNMPGDLSEKKPPESKDSLTPFHSVRSRWHAFFSIPVSRFPFPVSGFRFPACPEGLFSGLPIFHLKSFYILHSPFYIPIQHKNSPSKLH